MRIAQMHLYGLITLIFIQAFMAVLTSGDIIVAPQGDLLVINNGFIEVTFDLSKGASIKNIKAIHKDFAGTPVNKYGIAAVRGGGPNVEIVAFDIISNDNPWYGIALSTRSDYRIVEQNANHTVIELSYTLGSPFQGLKVVKTVKIPANSFKFYVNVTLQNTGGSQIVLDLSGPWGRPVGYMLEIVTKMGESGTDELRFVMFEDKSFNVLPPDESFVNYRYESRIAGIGIFDKTTESSPWGFMLGVFCLDESTIKRTYGIWLERGAGGANNILNRVEFKSVTLNPGDRVDYKFVFYAGPLHKVYVVDELGLPESTFNSVFYNPKFSPRPPGREIKLELPYSVTASLDIGSDASLPRGVIVVQDPDKIYEVVYEINSTSLKLGLWSNASYYVINVEPIEGFTQDERYAYRFIGVMLPNGTVIPAPYATVYLQHGWNIKLVFEMKPMIHVSLKLITEDKLGLPQQAGDLKVYVKTLSGELVLDATSREDSRVLTVSDHRFSPPKPGLLPGEKYVIIVTAQAGGYVIERVLVNGVERKFTVHEGYALVVVDPGKDMELNIELLYSPAGATVGMLYMWISLTIVLLAATILIAVVKRAKTER